MVGEDEAITVDYGSYIPSLRMSIVKRNCESTCTPNSLILGVVYINNSRIEVLLTSAVEVLARARDLVHPLMPY